MPRPLLCLLASVALFAVGCGAEPPAAANPPAPATNTPADYQAGACGGITGAVTWDRDTPIPTVAPVMDVRPRADGAGYDTRALTHPYAPRINRFTYAVGGVVVSLRGVNPARAKPWDLPPVSVEIRDSQLVVKQGERPPERVGFVRRGEPVKFQSCEPAFHVLRGRGAAFFALPFPDPDKPLERAFDACGRIELTSAAGYPWHAADLFVCDHPYYTVADADGRFQFAQVPEGKYDLVAWHPNWVSTASDRSPETGLVTRHVYAPPLESSRPVVVVAGDVRLATLTLPR